MANVKNLDALLSDTSIPVEEEKERKRELIPDLQITQYAMDRAFTYARLVCEVTEAENECIGYLITPKKNKGRVVSDVYLPKEQEVSGASVEISPEDVIKAGREIDQQGYRVLGWWHSHAGMSTFHSGTDERNQMTVLNAISPVNFVSEINKKMIGNGNLEVIVEDGKLVVIDRKNSGVRYIMDVKDPSGIELASLRIEEESRTGFAYSLVVHDTRKKYLFKTKKAKKIGKILSPSCEDEEATIKKGLETGERNPYAEVATRIYCADCKETRDSSKKVPITILDSNGEKLDETEMRKEVKDRVKERKSFFGGIFSGWGGFSSPWSGTSSGRTYDLDRYNYAGSPAYIHHSQYTPSSIPGVSVSSSKSRKLNEEVFADERTSAELRNSCAQNNFDQYDDEYGLVMNFDGRKWVFVMGSPGQVGGWIDVTSKQKEFKSFKTKRGKFLRWIDPDRVCIIDGKKCRYNTKLNQWEEEE